MTPFLILSLPRSGTQLLTAHLNCCRDVHAHGEVLNQIDTSVSTDDIVWRCWQNTPRYRAVGATILHEQLTPRPLMLTSLLAIHNMRVIVLERGNQLERIRSTVQAGTVWDWSVDHPPKNLPTINLHPGRTLRELKTATLFYKDLTAIRNPVLWLYYEDLAADPSSMDRVWQFLDVPNPGPTLNTGTYKQESRPLAETVANWDDIKTHLAGTRYAQ